MKYNLYFILLFLLTVSGFAQTDNISKIDELFTNWNSTKTPGCAVGVIMDDKVLFSKYYGMANLEDEIPINIDSKFSIASLTKQFTAYCIAILIHQDKINLEDDIRLYLPEFPYSIDTIRIKHLIYHINGLDELSEMIRVCGYSYDDVIDMQSIKKLIYNNSKPHFKPGEKFEYSNSGYFLLAEIIENVSGLSIGKFAEKNIFKPLGMNDTYYYAEPLSLKDINTVSYSQNVFGDYQKHVLHTVPVGSGNVISTLHDLLIWEQNFYNDKLYNNGLDSILYRKGILNNGDRINYYFGLKSGQYKEMPIIYHHGDFNSFESVILRIPQKRISVIILSNDQMAKTFLDNYSLANKVIDYLLDNNSKPEVPKNVISQLISEKQVKNYVGTYKSKNGYTNICFDDGQLKLSHSWGDWYYSIFPKSDTVFYDIYDFDYEYKFKTDKDSNVVGLWTYHTNYMEKVNIDSIFKILDDYSGAFYCKDLNITYLLYKNENKMYCTINNKESQELIITGKDSFRYKRNTLKLVRNDLDNVIGLKTNNRYEFIKLE
jgi:CubicO group peptidase (beta-lactamase class C family)